MALHPLAGLPAPKECLIDSDALVRNYFDRQPDPENPLERVSFGTSGHRGTPPDGTFNEAHILAITQAICDYRVVNGFSGPLYLGSDTHAASSPAQQTALEVLSANGVAAVIQSGGGATPTPVISHAIITFNRGRASGLADGIVITPSHNPPADGGFKYNPPHGGPADSDVTTWIENRANELLRGGNSGVKRAASITAKAVNLAAPYIADLASVLNLDAIAGAKLKIGVHPLGGASVAYWEPIAATYGLDITLVSKAVDPAFSFMTLDHDGKIRMDCSSPYAMASLVALKDNFDIAFGTDPDADRHGIVTRSAGLLNPNHYLAVAIGYLLSHRPNWPASAAVGKTLVSSLIIDKVVASHGRRLNEVPVGFKWFAHGLADGSICFGGEESAGASFLRKDGGAWSTDKDGLLLCLLAAEITAVTGRDPGERYRELAGQFGATWYTRVDTPATVEQKAKLKKLTPESIALASLGGDPIEAKMTHAPGNGAAIGGIKLVTANAWVAARPSGTENICKLYAESAVSGEHLQAVLRDAQALLD
ncbi:MAG: phosphoglucomutase (alpha-D-glucose-1,6-bisphosphate-dependent) [Bryobacteraceae bacterium]|nr:phosphoglucomutase (alpha-D-glucose-1,6-bisphosphate-dependent) [Bryobacteraceae bacterium]